MTRCKITVIKKTINPELANQYCVDKVSLCPCFEEGQEFICELGKPGNFCDWAGGPSTRWLPPCSREEISRTGFLKGG